VNELSEHLTNHLLRSRLMDLTFSLYESLADFLADMVILDGGDEPDVDVAIILNRLNTASMDCLADIELLFPILRSIRMSLVES
jgi:hypothetical protein